MTAESTPTPAVASAVNSRPLQTFANSFWTPDYLQGINVLFSKLDQGIAENAEVINFVSARISLESAYASNLQTSSQDAMTSKTAASGFNRDEGASLKQAFQMTVEESRIQGDEHSRIVAALERMVRGPFSQYAAAHKTRITAARSTLVSLTKEYQQAVSNVNKAQQAYFTKARQLEDFSDPTISSFPRIITSPTASSSMGGISLTLNKPDSVPKPKPESPPQIVEPQKIEIGHLSYSPEEFSPLLKSMIGTIPQETLRIPILGSYDNVTVGEDIIRYVRKYLNLKSLGQAEKFGQGLVDNGFLRLVGSVGSKFSGSTNSKYQWLPKAFDFDPKSYFETEAAAEEVSSPISNIGSLVRSSTFGSNKSSQNKPATASRFSMVSGYISGLLNEDGEGDDSSKSGSAGRESQMSKLQREIADSDQHYQDLVTSLDLQRCQLEQKVYETLEFVQQCERDRLIAIKTVLRDFASSISKSIDNLNQTTSRMFMYEEIVDPIKDLNYLIERYKTGNYAPNPVVYDNFFNATKIQSFGVDLKYSSFIVPAFLDFLAHPPTELGGTAPKIETTEPEDNSDNQSQKSYGSVASDKTAEFPSAKPTLAVSTSAGAISEASKIKYRNIPKDFKAVLAALWTSHQASSVDIQSLRSVINTGKEFNAFEVLHEVPLPIVVSTLKEFLLELPDSIVSSTVYDVIKTTYTKPNPTTIANLDEKAAIEDRALKHSQRIERLVGLLSHLPKINIDTLQNLVTHFAEICGLPEASDPSIEDEIPEAVNDIVRALAPYILRPRITTALTMTDKHPAQFLQDLITSRVQIFEQVQRRLSDAQEARTRSRSASSSEANRRFQIEARNREIANAAILAASSTDGTANHDTNASGSSQNSAPLTVAPSTPTMSSSTLRPLTLSPAARRKSGSLVAAPSNGSGGSEFLSVSTPERHHRRSLSSSSRPPLSMFLSPEVRRPE